MCRVVAINMRQAQAGVVSAGSGRARRTETWRYRARGRYWLTGSPGPRDWYANLLTHPELTLHLAGLDVATRGRPVTDPGERALLFGEIVPTLDWAESLESWVEGNPLVEIELGWFRGAHDHADPS